MFFLIVAQSDLTLCGTKFPIPAFVKSHERKSFRLFRTLKQQVPVSHPKGPLDFRPSGKRTVVEKQLGNFLSKKRFDLLAKVVLKRSSFKMT